MPKCRGVTRTHGLPQLVLAVLSLMVLVAPAYADTATFSIDSQDLSGALKAYALQSHREIFFAPELARGRQSKGVRGKFDDLKALNIILEGTGLHFSVTASDAILIRDPAEKAEPVSATGLPTSATADPVDPPIRVAQVDETPAGSSAAEKGKDEDSASKNKTAGLEEIVVTASKRPERLEDVPLAIQAITSEQLYMLGARSFDDYAGTVAGLQVAQIGAGRDEIFMRGVAAPQGYIGMESAVGIYLDDVPISEGSSQPDLNLYDVDRVEVLRGPQGTLYGSASLGGTIRIITNRPKLNVTEGLVDTELSETQHGGFNASYDTTINLPVVTDYAAVRAVFYGRNLSGYIDDPTLDRTQVNDANTYGGRVALRVVPEDQLTLDFNVLYQRSAQGGYNQADNVGATYTALDQYRQLPEPFLDRGEVYNATIQYQGSAANLTSSTSYSDRSRNVSDDDTGFELFGNDALTHSLQVYETTSYTEEIRAASIQTKPVSWLAGIYLNQATTRFFQSIESAGAGLLLDLPSDNVALLKQSTTTGQAALFGEVGYSPIDRLTLTVGLRAAEVQLASNALRTGYIFGAGLVNSDNTTQHDFLPKFNVAYKLTPDALVYGTASKGFRVGGVNTTFVPTSDGFVFPASYKSDSLWNYELGFKGAFFDQRMTVDADVFYIDWSNIQLDLQHGNYDYYANAGDAINRGIEAQTAIKISRAVQIGGQATYTNAELSTTTPGVGSAGERLPYVPKLSTSVFAEYDLPLDHGGRFYVRADAQHVSTMYTGFGDVSDYTYGNYTLANVKLGLDRGPWRCALFVRNLADQRARLYATGYYAAVVTSPNVDSLTVTRPRTIGLQLSRSF